MEPICSLPHSQQSAFKQARKKINRTGECVSFSIQEITTVARALINQNAGRRIPVLRARQRAAANRMPDPFHWVEHEEEKEEKEEEEEEEKKKKKKKKKNPARRESKPNPLVVQTLD
jgi:hypothetical protein